MLPEVLFLNIASWFTEVEGYAIGIVDFSGCLTVVEAIDQA